MTKQAETSIEHRRAWDTIPWLVNGSATGEQRRALEAHLHDCDDCRDELERQRALQAAMSLPAADAPDAEVGLARLMARIDDATRDSAWAAAAAAAPRRRLGVGALVVALAGAVVLEAV